MPHGLQGSNSPGQDEVSARQASVSATASTSPRNPGKGNSTMPPGTGSQSASANSSSQSWSLHRTGWAALDAARIYPGVPLLSYGGDCTGNFIFTDPTGSTVYIGTAAHCATPLAEFSANSAGGNDCDRLQGPTRPDESLAFIGPNLTWDADYDARGRYVYNSYWTMLAKGEGDSLTCLFNDFALIEIDPEHRRLANPTLAGFGGPEGMSNQSGQDGELVYTTGGTVFRTAPRVQDDLGIPPLQEETRERIGIVANALRPAPQGSQTWSGSAYFPGLCLPGDSGSPVVDDNGMAVGVIHAMVAGNALGCEFTLLAKALEYMRVNGGPNVVLHHGIDGFTPPI